MPLGDSAEPVGAFHDSANLNLAKRRLCAALGISLGSSELLLRDFRRPCPCCTHRLHPPIEPPIGQTHQFGRSKKLLPRHHFHDPPPTSGESNYAHRSRPYHGSRNSGDSAQPVERGKCHEGQQAPGVVEQQPDGSEEELGHHTVCATMRCTVPVPTRNCLAILCRPERPGAAKVWRMRRSTSASMKGRRQCMPAALAGAIRFISPAGQLPSRRSEWGASTSRVVVSTAPLNGSNGRDLDLPLIGAADTFVSLQAREACHLRPSDRCAQSLEISSVGPYLNQV
jgi:hypothetical protein